MQMNTSLQEYKHSITYPAISQSGDIYLHSIVSEIRCVNEAEEERLGGELYHQISIEAASHWERERVFGPGIEIHPVKYDRYVLWPRDTMIESSIDTQMEKKKLCSGMEEQWRHLFWDQQLLWTGEEKSRL